MSAAKKGAKGNKTAHVLNLLTAPGEAAAPVEESAEGAVRESAQPAAGRPLLPPILEVAQANDIDLSQQIQQALEDELLQEEVPAPEPEPAPAPPASSGGKMSQEEIEKLLAANAPPQPEPEPEPAPPAPSGGKMSQEEIEKLLAANAPPQPEPEPAPAPPAPSGGKMSQEEIEKLLAANAPPQPEPEPAPAPPAPSGGKMSQEEIEKFLAANAPPQPEPEPPKPKPAPRPGPTSVPELTAEQKEDITFLNVMQILVEEKAPRYIKMFGLCPCKRCEADVIALTLSNLVPKYVVLPKVDRIPMLTVYEGRYSSTIFAQLTRACKTVLDHPHHNREN